MRVEASADSARLSSIDMVGGIDPQITENVSLALEKADKFEARLLVAGFNPAQIADLLQILRADLRERFVEYLRPDFDPSVLPELEEEIRNSVATQMGDKAIARAIIRLESDDALLLISSLPQAMQRHVMEAIPAEFRELLEEGLAFPPETAGRLMQRNFVSVPAFWSVGEIIDFMREADDLPTDFYDIFVVDSRHRPIGKVPLNRLLRSKRPVRINEFMIEDIVTVNAGMDQEDVAFLFSQHDLISAPVVDGGGRLIGMITIDDIVDVIQEEAKEDIMGLAGVKSDDLYAAVLDTGCSRFSWLFLNLVTALLVSIVIGFFEVTLDKIVMLAVLMPIVASMGGNAGTQTMTIAVRALATRELTSANALRLLGKETLVGFFNGLVFAILIGGIGWFWTASWMIGAVIAAAMMITLVVAGLSGMFIPIALERLQVDPAVASGVILTTVTDITAFSVFLGLAALILI
ncbi:MAG: magnesium transporter [Rhodospirillaceae bacterium]|jgi:magnesium transporter